MISRCCKCRKKTKSYVCKHCEHRICSSCEILTNKSEQSKPVKVKK